jgi:sigma-B regulation protein RsbU (phosphoserine phosphatase)
MKSIEQRKTVERDLALAEETQRSLLPREIPELPHLKLTAFSKPTRYVGGDFYDFQQTPEGGLIAVLADISGKGVAASVVNSMLLGCLQLLLQDGKPPDVALNRLNKFIHSKSTGRFATLFLCCLMPDGKGQYISAGHNPAFIYRAGTGTIDEWPSTSLVLGAFDFVTFEGMPVEIGPGDLVFVYSDGLTEAENVAGEMFGEERVKEIILQLGAMGAARVQEAMIASIQEFTRGRDQTDDITIVIAQRT